MSCDYETKEKYCEWRDEVVPRMGKEHTRLAAENEKLRAENDELRDHNKLLLEHNNELSEETEAGELWDWKDRAKRAEEQLAQAQRELEQCRHELEVERGMYSDLQEDLVEAERELAEARGWADRYKSDLAESHKDACAAAGVWRAQLAAETKRREVLEARAYRLVKFVGEIACIARKDVPEGWEVIHGEAQALTAPCCRR